MQRRELLAGAAATGLAGLAGTTGHAATAAAKSLDFDDPRDALYAVRKMSGDLTGGKEVVSWMKGTVWSIFNDGSEMQPLFYAGSLAFSRSWQDADDSYKNTANFVICYLDLDTEEVLEEWYNPWLKRTVAVVNYASRIDTIARARTAVSQHTSARVQWMVDGDNVIRWTDGQMRKKNPITPDKWPLASVGEWYTKNQSSQMIASLAQLQNPELTSVNALTMGQRHGPWYPWMQMGQAPGRTYRRDVSKKAASLDDVPGPIPAYAAKHFPQFMAAPEEWTGVYVDPEVLWTREQPPEVPS